MVFLCVGCFRGLLSLQGLNDICWSYLYLVMQLYVSMLVLFDLCSTFDTIDHEVLLLILRDRFSIHDNVFNWFHSYLPGRTWTFYHGGKYSTPQPLNCSVCLGVDTRTAGIHSSHPPKTVLIFQKNTTSTATYVQTTHSITQNVDLMTSLPSFRM